MFDSVDTPAPWAYSWCWVYYFSVVLTFAGAIMIAVTSWKKMNMVAIVGLILITLIQAAHGLTYFWVCRSSLKPSQ